MSFLFLIGGSVWWAMSRVKSIGFARTDFVDLVANGNNIHSNQQQG